MLAEGLNGLSQLNSYRLGQRTQGTGICEGTVPPIRVELRWSRFSKRTEARKVFAVGACVYAQADREGRPVRIGKASKGLDDRYHGGNGGAMDAAMHGSANLVFVAPVEMDLCKLVEDELIWQGRSVLSYNIQGRLIPPSQRLILVHGGDAPILTEFDAFAL